jgi:hypothetical protein
MLLMNAVFLAEITRRVKIKPQLTPHDGVSRGFGVYKLYIGPRPQATYWTVWGGSYDNPETAAMEIYFTNWLFPVYSMADLLAVENSFYIEGGLLYVRLPVHPWLYAGSAVLMAMRQGFLSGPKNLGHPAELFLDGRYAEARFSPSSFSVKLADVVSGMTLFGTFSITLDNRDGMFDGSDAVELYNSPVNVLKASAENPEYGDFHVIRTGMAESVNIDSEKITVTVADLFRSLDGAVCRLISADEFPVEKEDALGKPLPVVFGTVTMPLIEIAYAETESGDDVTVSAKYLVAERITSFIGLYDEDGYPLPYTIEGLVIVFNKTSAKDKKVKPKYARLAGYPDSRTGSVITALAARDSPLQYAPSVWDIEETDWYTARSPFLGVAFTGGDIKTAVKTALQSDMAYLIQKNDGRLTIRKWGADYAVHEIPGWLITTQPEKNFKDAEKNYFSSCSVDGAYNYFTKKHGITRIYDGAENAAVEKYLKARRAEYSTTLAETAAIDNLAALLAGRFSVMKDTVRVSVGSDTSLFNLLDKVKMKIIVNGRNYSENETWIIKEIDPANDKLVLEES